MVRDTKTQTNSKPPSSLSGLSLAERLQEGSAGAWQELVELYGPLVDSWCRRSNVPTHAIADIAQEVFLTAFRSLTNFDATQENASFRGWLWTVTRTRIVDYFRKQPGQRRAHGGSTAMANMHLVPDPVPMDEPTEVLQASSFVASSVRPDSR